MASDPPNVNPGDRLTATWMNAVVGAVKRRNNVRPRGVQWAGGNVSDCPFGETILVENVISIRGGLAYVGNKNFTVPPYDVNITSDRVVKIYLAITLTVNKDDDDQLLLPGVRTSTWTPIMLEIANTSPYPDSTSPTLPTGEGTMIVPLGVLTVLDESATFVPTDCCDIRVSHCAGTLSHSRTCPVTPAPFTNTNIINF